MAHIGWRFDTIEPSSGFLSFPGDDWVGLCHKVHGHGMKANLEVGILFGAGGGVLLAHMPII